MDWRRNRCPNDWREARVMRSFLGFQGSQPGRPGKDPHDPRLKSYENDFALCIVNFLQPKVETRRNDKSGLI